LNSGATQEPPLLFELSILGGLVFVEGAGQRQSAAKRKGLPRDGGGGRGGVLKGFREVRQLLGEAIKGTDNCDVGRKGRGEGEERSHPTPARFAARDRKVGSIGSGGEGFGVLLSHRKGTLTLPRQ